MNHEQNIACANGGFVTEDAVRGAMSRRWRTRARSAGAARPARSGAVGPGAADRATRRANRSVALRRWSVAELIANGVARPPAGGTAH